MEDIDFTIGRLSRDTGVNIETVRYYERIGLIPKPQRSEGGRRVFTASDVQRLSFIRRGPLELEFFHMPDLKPKESWFSACIRVDDLDVLYADFLKAGLPEDRSSMPRIGKIEVEAHGIRLFALVDPEGSLLRCIDNHSTV
jgi:hypothetical protein